MMKIEQMQYMSENWEDFSKFVTFGFNSYGNIACDEKHGCYYCKFYHDPASSQSCLPQFSKEEFEEKHPECFV